MRVYDFAAGLTMPARGVIDLGQSFSPASLPGLVASFDALDAATVAVNGSNNVTTVQNKVSGGPDLVASPIGGPLYIASDPRVGGRPCFSWPNATNQLGLEFAAVDLMCSEVFLVMQYKDGADDMGDEPVSIITDRGCVTGSGNRILVSGFGIWSNYKMDQARLNGAAPSNTILPLPLSVMRLSMQDNSEDPSRAIRLGAVGARNNNNSQRAWQGIICEVLAWDVANGPMGDADATKVETYLSAKWGVA